NGRVTLFSGKIEMGQGGHTSLAQMAAEELGVSLDAINVVMGDTDQCPWDAGTWGSQSTRRFGPAVRAAAAEARTVMMKLASEKLGKPREQLVVSNGVVTDGKQSISYGDLAKGKQIARLVDEKAVLRSAREFKVIGKPTKRLDGRDTVTGRAESVGDYFVKNGGDGDVKTNRGDVKSITANIVESTFRTGYLAHAPMEPHTAAAEWKDGRITAWVGTQSPFGTRTRIAQSLGLDESKVRVITPFVGGGFGGKSPAPQAVEAARLAQIGGKRVM